MHRQRDGDEISLGGKVIYFFGCPTHANAIIERAEREGEYRVV